MFFVTDVDLTDAQFVILKTHFPWLRSVRTDDEFVYESFDDEEPHFPLHSSDLEREFHHSVKTDSRFSVAFAGNLSDHNSITAVYFLHD